MVSILEGIGRGQKMFNKTTRERVFICGERGLIILTPV